MIYDRPYMRDPFPRKDGQLLLWLIGITIGVFVLQILLENWFRSPWLSRTFALSHFNIARGFLWTLFTYGFLHASFLHILGNMLGLFFLGRALLQVMGGQRFLALYAVAIFAGGLFWYLVDLIQGGGIVVGASAGVLALLGTYATLYPNQRITFLLFLIIPITILPKYLFYIILGISFLGLLTMEMAGQGGIAHSAHLGGLLVGWLYARYWHTERAHQPLFGTTSGSGAKMELPSWFKKKSQTPTPAYKVNLTGTRELHAEVDRILDKINRDGFGSLTKEEKKTLDDARDILSKRK